VSDDDWTSLWGDWEMVLGRIQGKKCHKYQLAAGYPVRLSDLLAANCRVGVVGTVGSGQRLCVHLILTGKAQKIWSSQTSDGQRES
jgi:hypothetical protein